MSDHLVTDTLTCLEQGLELLGRLTPEQYTAPQKACFNSAVGEHIRHNLDHYNCFLEGMTTGWVDYDARMRERLVETDPNYAIGQLRTVAQVVQALEAANLARDVSVKTETGSGAPEDQAWTKSTGRRELQFLLSHTIHHYALIAVICRQMGVAVEPAFGVAPSTRRHQLQQGAACAR